MTAPIDPIPSGFRTLTPHLVVRRGTEALEFYQQAFGAEVLDKALAPGGKSLLHADLRIGDSVFMLADEYPDGGPVGSPDSQSGTTVVLHIYTGDVEAAFQRAVKAGCKVEMPLKDCSWGDRYGQLIDPFGHCWSLAARLAPPPRQASSAAQRRRKPAAFLKAPRRRTALAIRSRRSRENPCARASNLVRISSSVRGSRGSPLG